MLYMAASQDERPRPLRFGTFGAGKSRHHKLECRRPDRSQVARLLRALPRMERRERALRFLSPSDDLKKFFDTAIP